MLSLAVWKLQRMAGKARVTTTAERQSHEQRSSGPVETGHDSATDPAIGGVGSAG
jgi:hypothetical protein